MDVFVYLNIFMFVWRIADASDGFVLQLFGFCMYTICIGSTLCFVHVIFDTFLCSGSLSHYFMYEINIKGHKLRDVERTSVYYIYACMFVLVGI